MRVASKEIVYGLLNELHCCGPAAYNKVSFLCGEILCRLFFLFRNFTLVFLILEVVVRGGVRSFIILVLAYFV